jgi:signal transduction histidine kinase
MLSRNFIGFFGALSSIFIIGLTVMLILFLTRPELFEWQHASREHSPWFLCLIPLAFFLLAGFVGRMGFRRVGRPMADILNGIDAVSRGDLSVRLDESGRGPFGTVMRSFNHMTAELERSEQQRRNMTADIAHELRNPLHIIQGNLEGMLDMVYEPTPEIIGATLEETRLLARLVSDLQTLSLAESGQLPLHKTNFLMADLLADVVTSFSASAAEQGVELAAEGGEGIQVSADYDRLDQVLSNLVSNALRHTSNGGIIRISAAKEVDALTITVEDSGEGISTEDLPYIFDRFWKGDRARTRDGSGSGLGLAIARQLVRAHGGSINVESRVGVGTRFIIKLPLV